MDPLYAVERTLGRYADFSGRASRAEFWWWTLALVVGFFGLATLDGFFLIGLMGGQPPVDPGFPVTLPAALALITPHLAVSVRRLHDAGLSGWFLLTFFVPAVGALALIVLLALPGDPRENEWGQPPA